MTATKLSPCCARRHSQLIHEQTNLARLARKAASYQAKNRDLTKLKADIERAKAAVAEQQEALIDHEAEHAA